MARLRSKMLVPSHGWFFMQGNIKLAGGTFDGTVDLIRRHRKSNNLPEGDPERDLVEFTCQRQPRYCDNSPNDPSPKQLQFHEQVGDFLGNYGRWAKMGFETVEQDEANRRADICWKCPANQKIHDKEKVGCCGGKWRDVFKNVSKEMAQALVWPALRNKVTPADNELYTCNVCGCPNKASVWLPKKAFDYDATTLEKFREVSGGKCWKLGGR